MTVYLDVVMLLNFMVDWLLLMAANRLCGRPPTPGRTALGGLLGSIYAGICLLPGFSFMGGMLWRIVALAAMALIAYGLQWDSLRRGLVFLLLSMALGGFALCLGSSGFWTLTGAAAGVCALCVWGLRGKIGAAGYIPVELTYGDRHLKVTALQDTGNTLRDPVTGGPVLVVDSHTAAKLTGLTSDQLSRPVESIGAIPGLRLIPYRAVGTQNGLLLGMQLNHVKIGSWKGSRVVAFAPGKLSVAGEYQALTGGAA